MPEVDVESIGGLSILGLMLKHWMDENLRDPDSVKHVKNLNAAVVVRVSGMVITIYFRDGEIRMENGAAEKPTASVEGSLDAFLGIGTGRRNPILTLIKREVKFKGNLLKLFKIRKVIIPRGLI